MARVILTAMLSISYLLQMNMANPTQCPAMCFCDLPSHYVSCISDGMDDVPLDIPKLTTKLELRSYTIGRLTNGQINTLRELTELKLERNKISSIESSSFSQLMKLQRLELAYNNITALTSATFSGQMSLVHLDLSKNNITTLKWAFMDLISLKQLNLQENHIAILKQDTFIGLANVRYLNLDMNNISRIHAQTFMYLTRLEHLILSNNPIAVLNQLEFHGTALQYIDLSNTRLKDVPKQLNKNLRNVRLANNNISEVEEHDFAAYSQLKTLILDDNGLKVIGTNAFAGQSLTMLDANGNNLRTIPSGLPIDLITMNLERNTILEINNESFKNLTNLQRLSLAGNFIKKIDENSFCSLDSLMNLNLQSNLIESIAEQTFWNLTKLKTLDLSHNAIKYLPGNLFKNSGSLDVLRLSQITSDVKVDEDTFSGLSNLKSLSLQSSPTLLRKITESRKLLESLRNIHELNIINNSITSLRSDFSVFFPHINAIALYDNQWHCNQSILWLTKWMSHTTIHFFQINSIKCTTPQYLSSYLIMNLNENVFQQTTTDLPFPPTSNTKIWVQITRAARIRIPKIITSRTTTKPFFEKFKSTEIQKIVKPMLPSTIKSSTKTPPSTVKKSTEKSSKANQTTSPSTVKKSTQKSSKANQRTASKMLTSPMTTEESITSAAEITEKSRTSFVFIPLSTIVTTSTAVARPMLQNYRNGTSEKKSGPETYDLKKNSMATLLGSIFAVCTIVTAILTIIVFLAVRKRQKKRTRERTLSRHSSITRPKSEPRQLLLNAGLSRQNSLNRMSGERSACSTPTEIPQMNAHETSDRLYLALQKATSFDDQVSLLT